MAAGGDDLGANFLSGKKATYTHFLWRIPVAWRTVSDLVFYHQPLEIYDL